MEDKWVQLYVRAPVGNGYTTPEAMKRVDEHLIQEFSFFVTFVAPTGLPVRGEDGTFEIRVQLETLVSKVKEILTQHYGLEIVNEVVN